MLLLQVLMLGGRDIICVAEDARLQAERLVNAPLTQMVYKDYSHMDFVSAVGLLGHLVWQNATNATVAAPQVQLCTCQQHFYKNPAVCPGCGTLYSLHVRRGPDELPGWRY